MGDVKPMSVDGSLCPWHGGNHNALCFCRQDKTYYAQTCELHMVQRLDAADMVEHECEVTGLEA
jgi:hypothetical protein